ncbi:MAG: PSP1 domain-containing protein [Chloroflexia bacterium]
MPKVVGVRLRHPGLLYDFEVGEEEYPKGSWVVVETARGQDIGQVVVPAREIAAEEVRGELKPVVRLATAEDLERMRRFREREPEALVRAREQVAELGLPMRLVAAEYTYNGRCLTIYFTAENRVDFRELVKRLARLFRTRIELRQIGARDEARLLGGIGICGRPLCCATFLGDFLRISVRMAKEQDLPLSPMKISGVCGRLLCCLSYEHDQYREIKDRLPTVGEEVATLRGRGKVVAVNVPRETVTVELRPELRVEADLAELARAAQLEEEGKLPHCQPAYVDATERLETVPSEPQIVCREEKPSRRRRRRSKEGGAPASAPAPVAPAAEVQMAKPAAPAAEQRRRPRRPLRRRPTA